MRRLLIVPVILLCVACASMARQHVAVFNYSDFGPQVIASEVVGMEWWQWQAHGDSRPRSYDIKIVVYRDIPLDEVRKQHPVDETGERDYRYLNYETALTYLNEKINDNVLEDVTATLEATRSRLIGELGGH
jgi:hypothetical protein